MSNIQQSGPGTFVTTMQELYDYRNEIKLQPGREITLKMEKPRKKGGNAVEYTIQGYMHPELRKWLGFPKRMRPDGTYEFQIKRFKGVKKFNLGNLEEAYEYFIWKNSAFFKGSTMQRITGNFRNLIVEYDQESSAQATIENRRIAHDMEGQILNWTEQQVKDFGAIFKINPKENSPAIIRESILNKLANDPKNVKTLYETMENRTQFLIELRKGQFANLVTFDRAKGVMYRETVLGSSEDAAIERLRKDPNLFLMFKDDIEQQLPNSTVSTITNTSSFAKEKDRVKVIEHPQPAPPVDVKGLVQDALKEVLSNYDLVPKQKENTQTEKKEEQPVLAENEDYSGFDDEPATHA